MFALLLAAQAAAASPGAVPPNARLVTRTEIADKAAAARLERNTGLTLQWIVWEKRGTITATTAKGVMRLRGRQLSLEDRGSVHIDGVVKRIAATHFTFVGRIEIIGAPDAARECIRDGDMEFRITGKRRYWRLQQMTVCDGLTDYVDIYF